MKMEHKKEYLTIIVIVIAATLILMWGSQQHISVTINNTPDPIILAEQDFILQSSTGNIEVGSSSYDNVLAVFPRGKTLGRSTLYRPEGEPFFLEFTKKSNILTVVHIEERSLSTSRGIGVGDTMEKVVEAYGKNYSSVSTGEPENLDMVYGEGNKIVFKITKGLVSKIIIQHDATPAT